MGDVLLFVDGAIYRGICKLTTSVGNFTTISKQRVVIFEQSMVWSVLHRVPLQPR